MFGVVSNKGPVCCEVGWLRCWSRKQQRISRVDKWIGREQNNGIGGTQQTSAFV